MENKSPDIKTNSENGKQQFQSRPNSAGILSPVSKQTQLFQLRRNKVSDFSEPVPSEGQVTSAGSRSVHCKSGVVASCAGKIDPSVIATVLTSKEYIGPDVLIIIGFLLLLIGLGVVLLGMYAPSGIDELQSMIFTIGPSMMGIGLLFTCLRLLFWKPRLCVCCRRFDRKKEAKLAAKMSAKILKPPASNGVGAKPKVGRPKTTLGGRVPNPMLSSATRMRAGSTGISLSAASSIERAVNGTRTDGSKQLAPFTKCNCNPSAPCEKCRRRLREIAHEGLANLDARSGVGLPRPQVPVSFRLANYETAVLIDSKGTGQPNDPNDTSTDEHTSNSKVVTKGNSIKNMNGDSGIGGGDEQQSEDITDFIRQEEEEEEAKDGFYSSGDEDETEEKTEKPIARTASQEFDEAFKETMKDLGGNAAS